MPRALAASAAASGDSLPVLFTPSVSSTTTLDFACVPRRRLTLAAMADPMAVPSSDCPMLTRSRFCCSQSWSRVTGLTRYGLPANAIRPIRSLGRWSMNLETTDLTTSMRFTLWLSMRKSSACIEPETSSARTMSMPLAVISVRLLPRCGRASPAIIRAAASRDSSHSQFPARLRLRRATSRARPTWEYWTAATGPRRPRHRATSGSSASAQNHSGCRKRIMRRPPRGRPRRGPPLRARASRFRARRRARRGAAIPCSAG